MADLNNVCGRPEKDEAPDSQFMRLQHELRESYDEENLLLAELGLENSHRSLRDKAYRFESTDALAELTLQRGLERLTSTVDASDPALQPQRMQHDNIKPER